MYRLSDERGSYTKLHGGEYIKPRRWRPNHVILHTAPNAVQVCTTGLLYAFSVEAGPTLESCGAVGDYAQLQWLLQIQKPRLAVDEVSTYSKCTSNARQHQTLKFDGLQRVHSQLKKVCRHSPVLGRDILFQQRIFCEILK